MHTGAGGAITSSYLFGQGLTIFMPDTPKGWNHVGILTIALMRAP